MPTATAPSSPAKRHEQAAYKINEVGRLLGLSQTQMYRLIDKKAIRTFHEGTSHRASWAQVNAYLCSTGQPMLQPPEISVRGWKVTQVARLLSFCVRTTSELLRCLAIRRSGKMLAWSDVDGYLVKRELAVGFIR